MIIIEILLIISVFIKSFWLGIFVLTYVIYAKCEYERIKSELEACLFSLKIVREELSLTEKALTKTTNKPLPDWNSIADEIYPYKKCTIIRYDKQFVIVMTDGERLNKMFNTLEEAKEVIDERK